MKTNVLDFLEPGWQAEFSGRTAIVYEDTTLTFAGLIQLAGRFGTLITRRTEAVNQPIAVFLPRCPETVAANLGIVQSGNCYTNVDVKSPIERLRKLVKTVRPLLAITSREHVMRLTAVGLSRADIILVEDASEGLEIDESALARRRNRAIDTDPVCIINTSGSTGAPKSVVINHRSIIDFIDWVLGRFEFDENEIIGSLSPFYFDIYTLELFVTLARGAKIVVIPETCAAFPAKLIEFLECHAVSFIFWVPSVMVNIAARGLLPKADLSRLKKVFFAGEVFPTRPFNVWRRYLPQALFVNLYGPIEITVDCTCYVVDRDFADDEPLPIGVACQNTGILILNDKNEMANVNEIGELCVRGSSLAMGYWNNPEATKAAFVQNPLNPHYPETIYRTGDLVHLNDRGEIMFDGRKDYQIKHQGYRIELGEIENAVMSLDTIDSACVMYDADHQSIALFFTAREVLTAATIRRSLVDKLPKYMLPTVFRQLDEMPRNPNGKIDCYGLKLAHQGAGDAGAS
jgi:amino acid adenylation domain-containing protein